MFTPWHKTDCPRGHEIYTLGRLFFPHHYFILSLLDISLGEEKKVFFLKRHFYDHELTQEAAPVDHSLLIITV